MAIIANVVEIEVYVHDSDDLVRALPFGGLIDDLFVTSPGDVEGLVGNPLSNRFPTPAIAWGFLTEDPVENEYLLPPDVDMALDPPYYILGGPLHPEGSYLEPTIGQIWPRIG